MLISRHFAIFLFKYYHMHALCNFNFRNNNFASDFIFITTIQGDKYVEKFYFRKRMNSMSLICKKANYEYDLQEE